MSRVFRRWSRNALRLLLIVLMLVVIGVRFERKLVAVALSAVLVVAFAVLGHRSDDSAERD